MMAGEVVTLWVRSGDEGKSGPFCVLYIDHWVGSSSTTPQLQPAARGGNGIAWCAHWLTLLPGDSLETHC